MSTCNTCCTESTQETDTQVIHNKYVWNFCCCDNDGCMQVTNGCNQNGSGDGSGDGSGGDGSGGSTGGSTPDTTERLTEYFVTTTNTIDKDTLALFSIDVDSDNYIYAIGDRTTGDDGQAAYVYKFNKLGALLGKVKLEITGRNTKANGVFIKCGTDNHIYISAQSHSGLLVAKLDNQLNVVEHQCIEDSSYDTATAFELDSDNNLYIAGYYGPANSTLSILKFDSQLTLVGRKNTAGMEVSQINDFVLDSENHLVFVGQSKFDGSDYQGLLFKTDLNLNVISATKVSSDKQLIMYKIEEEGNGNYLIDTGLNIATERVYIVADKSLQIIDRKHTAAAPDTLKALKDGSIISTFGDEIVKLDKGAAYQTHISQNKYDVACVVEDGLGRLILASAANGAGNSHILALPDTLALSDESLAASAVLEKNNTIYEYIYTNPAVAESISITLATNTAVTLTKPELIVSDPDSTHTIEVVAP